MMGQPAFAAPGEKAILINTQRETRKTCHFYAILHPSAYSHFTYKELGLSDNLSPLTVK